MLTTFQTKFIVGDWHSINMEETSQGIAVYFIHGPWSPNQKDKEKGLYNLHWNFANEKDSLKVYSVDYEVKVV